MWFQTGCYYGHQNVMRLHCNTTRIYLLLCNQVVLISASNVFFFFFFHAVTHMTWIRSLVLYWGHVSLRNIWWHKISIFICSCKPFLCMQSLSSRSRIRPLLRSDFLKCLFALRYFKWQAVVCCILCWELHSNLTGSCSIFITAPSPVMWMSSSITFHQFILIRIFLLNPHAVIVLSESSKKKIWMSATRGIVTARSHITYGTVIV